MPDEGTWGTVTTNELQAWVVNLQIGNPNAADATLRKIVAQVERFAAQTFKKFPRVGRFVDLDDVVQNSLIRLLAAFREIRPQNRQHFYALANELIRRELLDLVKRYYGPHGDGTNIGQTALGEGAGEYAPLAPETAGELERIAAFHAAVAELPAEEREVIALSCYHDWSQKEIAFLLKMSVRTVQRTLESAKATLKQRIGEE
jgi:RNA polymerase sigma factor (sigma-70 family)